MRSLTRTALKLSLCILVGATATTSIRAQESDNVEQKFLTRIDSWKIQERSADRDVRLVDEVYRQFVTDFSITDETSMRIRMNEVLEPLFSRFPDYRLKYSSKNDYCPIVRAIFEARSSALSRKSEALNKEIGLLSLLNTYRSIKVQNKIDDIKGINLSQTDVAQAFTDQLGDGGDTHIKTDWGMMDYLIGPTSDANCD